MATAAATHLLKSAVFTPAGGSPSAVTFGNLQRFEVKKGGKIVAHGSDAQVAITAHFTDEIEAEVTVESTDASLATNAGLQPGIVGALVLTFQKRAVGKGAVAGQDKIVTAAQAMVGPYDATLPHADRSGAQFVFHCSDAANGADPFAYS